MSCYEWESGTIKIPSDQWTNFKEEILGSYNNLVVSSHAMALKVYYSILDAGSGIRGYDYPRSADILLRSQPTIQRDMIIASMFPIGHRRRKPLKPKKSNFKIATRRTNEINLSDFSIVFDNRSRLVRWEVYENDHSCNEARGHLVGKTFFVSLNRISWNRNSGGIIIGNDEYNRDSIEMGGGGNYVKDSFGPKGTKLVSNQVMAFM